LGTLRGAPPALYPLDLVPFVELRLFSFDDSSSQYSLFEPSVEDTNEEEEAEKAELAPSSSSVGRTRRGRIAAEDAILTRVVRLEVGNNRLKRGAAEEVNEEKGSF